VADCGIIRGVQFLDFDWNHSSENANLVMNPFITLIIVEYVAAAFWEWRKLNWWGGVYWLLAAGLNYVITKR